MDTKKGFRFEHFPQGGVCYLAPCKAKNLFLPEPGQMVSMINGELVEALCYPLQLFGVVSHYDNANKVFKVWPQWAFFSVNDPFERSSGDLLLLGSDGMNVLEKFGSEGSRFGNLAVIRRSKKTQRTLVGIKSDCRALPI